MSGLFVANFAHDSSSTNCIESIVREVRFGVADWLTGSAGGCRTACHHIDAWIAKGKKQLWSKQLIEII